MVHGNVIGSLHPKSCVEEIEATMEVEVEAEDNKTADEMAVEEIRKAAERQCLWWKRR